MFRGLGFMGLRVEAFRGLGVWGPGGQGSRDFGV